MRVFRKVVKSSILLLLVVSLIAILFDIMFPMQSIPLITRREFPFVLKYRIDNEIVIVHDELVCEFSGFAMYESDMRLIRKWDSYLKSGRGRVVLLKKDDLEIFFSHINSNEYGAVYMGDTSIYSDVVDVFPNAWYTIDFSNKNINSYIISAEEMAKTYDIELLSYTIAPPIKNIFLDVKVLLIGQVLLMCFLYCLVRGKKTGDGSMS